MTIAVLTIIIFALSWSNLYFIKKSTKLGESNEVLKKLVNIKDEQLKVASRPPDNPDTILKRMREDEGN